MAKRLASKSGRGRQLAQGNASQSPSDIPVDPAGELSPSMLGAMEADFDSKPAYRVMQNAVTQVSVQSLANRREVVTGAMPSLSVVLDDWPITDQKQSGRCWLFAGLNLLRAGAMKKMRLKEFEFSQNFLLFWDKLEKANYFLEAIIDTAASPIGDRTVDFLLQSPVADGGQWNMFVNLVRKYGLAPKSAMPESESSSNTRAMNDRLCSKLRQGAKALREMHAGGAGLPELRRQKREIMTAIHRILCIHLGTPPSRFDWQWKDSKKKFHRDLGLSPQQFASKYVTLPMDDYVTLVNDPRPTSPYGRVFTVGYLGNVVGGRPVRYLNVHIDVMKHIAMRTLQGGEPVWFGCDVIQQMDRDLGLWHANLRDYEAIYDTTFALDKASRLLYGHTCMTHAMLFTGVDVVAGKSRWWRVENSWGEKIGQKGFCLMSDSWFGEHMFEIAARRSFLPPALQRALTLPPIVLPPWDPMGSLAGRNSASNAGQQ